MLVTCASPSEASESEISDNDIGGMLSRRIEKLDYVVTSFYLKQKSISEKWRYRLGRRDCKHFITLALPNKSALILSRALATPNKPSLGRHRVVDLRVRGFLLILLIGLSLTHHVLPFFRTPVVLQKPGGCEVLVCCAHRWRWCAVCTNQRIHEVGRLA
jgi:hypothetical protein